MLIFCGKSPSVFLKSYLISLFLFIDRLPLSVYCQTVLHNGFLASNESESNNFNNTIASLGGMEEIETNSLDNKKINEGKEIELQGFNFPPMFVLNLDRSTDRWEGAQKQMIEVGLDVERLSAIDGRTLSNKELRKVSTLMAMYLQPRGVIGCYLSHRKFWQMVVDKKYPSAIIFEDDVKLVPDFKNKLHNHLVRLGTEEKYDVVLLGAIGRVSPDGNDHIAARIFSSYIGGNRPIKKFSDHYYQPRRPAVSFLVCYSTVFV